MKQRQSYIFKRAKHLNGLGQASRKSIRTLASAAVLATASVVAVPASAAVVEWAGLVVNSCIVTVGNHGSLGLAIDGNSLDSEQTGGLAANVLVTATGPNTVSLTAPDTTLASSGYNGQADTWLKYQSNQGHAGDWDEQGHSATVGAGQTMLTLHARMRDDQAFPMGAYKVSSELSCTPTSL